MIKKSDHWLIIAVFLILAGGIALTGWTPQETDSAQRAKLIIENRMVQRSLNAGQVTALNGSAADLATPAYQALKEQMIRMQAADPLIRHMYLARQQPDGLVIILVDSESPEAEDYLPPGMTDPDPSHILLNVFTARAEGTLGPFPGDQGPLVSSYTLVTDPGTGDVQGVFGIDVDARDWNAEIITSCLPVATGTLILIFILLVFSYTRERTRREREILEGSARTLRESEHRLNAIINFLPDATFVIDREGKVLIWNKAMEEMTGTPAGSILGKDNYEYALTFHGKRRPMLIDLVLEPGLEAAKDYTGGIHRQGDTLITESELQRPDGTHPFLAAKASPLRDVQGTMIGAIETIRDITLRIHAEKDLKDREERLTLLLQNVNDGIIVHGVSYKGPGRILEVNDHVCGILGYSREELLRMSIRDLDVPEQAEKIPRISEEVFLRKHAIFETDYIRKDGTRIPVEISASFFELDGEPTVLAIVRDITERKMLESEMEYHSSELLQYAVMLQQVNDKLNLMNRITRHDILNQLTAIVGYLGLMKEQVTDPKTGEYIDIVIRASQNIQGQIMFTKEYQDIGSQSPQWFDLRRVILSAAEQLNLAGMMLAVNIDRTEVYADPLLEKVFYTLLENAGRHGKTVTAIVFSFHETPAGLNIVYEDNGEGVPERQKENIFQRKFFKHTGYGLFLSVSILNITGITIRENGEEGKGARFEIFVPAGAYRFVN
jgi:PAS domain S-box-containing protein